MSVLVVGISHRSAPLALLERLALTVETAGKLARAVVDQEHVAESTVLATCNRIEIYADVERFHGSVEAISRLLIDQAGGNADELLPHLYVHYDDGAVSHLFHVASGLDSMAVGESQILGQARDALRHGQEGGTVGSSLNLLFQQALRVGKRSHAETDIDRLAPSLVKEALQRATDRIGDISGRRVLVIGAGSMAALAVATARRAGAEVVIANRTLAHGERLAEEYAAQAIELGDLTDSIAEADVLVASTGADGIVVSADQLAAARVGVDRPLIVVDLALPHDIEPSAGDLPGVTLINLASLAEAPSAGVDSEAMRAAEGVRRIVTEELAAFLAARRAASVTPTLVALRSMATGVVEAEMARLEHRADLDAKTRAEVLHSLRRVSDKLLHQPTVRVKELAGEDVAVSYTDALARLFALDQDTVDAVTRTGGGLR